MANYIDISSSSYQPCWGCGQLASSGDERNLYYGNFPFGIEHESCGQRIKILLQRSIRALKEMGGKDDDAQTWEIIKQALITTAARKLDNKPLKEISDEQQIRSAVEKKGMKAAVDVFRAISTMDDQTWKFHLKKRDKIMKGPEYETPEEKRAYIDKEIAQHHEMVIQQARRETDQIHTVFERINTQLENFLTELQRQENTTPYYILKDVIKPYYCISHEIKKVKKLLKILEESVEKFNWKVIFLGEEIPRLLKDTHIIVIKVEHIAFLPSSISIAEATEAWKKKYSYQVKEGQANVFFLDCLEWKNHHVSLIEINETLSSYRQGSKERPADL